MNKITLKLDKKKLRNGKILGTHKMGPKHLNWQEGLCGL